MTAPEKRTVDVPISAENTVRTDGNPRPLAPVMKLSVHPIGYSPSGLLHFFQGKLHQLFQAHHTGAEPAEAWIPIGGQVESDPESASLT